MLMPAARSGLGDLPELLRRRHPDEITAQPADWAGRHGSEAAELLGHGRQVIDDIEHTPAPAGSCAHERLLRHSINKRSGREKCVAQLASNPSAQVRATDNVHDARQSA
jgi:hypothetical protein